MAHCSGTIKVAMKVASINAREIVLVLVPRSGAALRLPVPAAEYGGVRRLVEEKVRAHGLDHRSTEIDAHVSRFVRGEDRWLRPFDAALGDFLAVDGERSRAALAHSAAVITMR